MSEAEKMLAQERAATDLLRASLAGVGMDGPFQIEGGGGFAGIFGKVLRYAICTTCGAMVRLDDPMEREPGEPPAERGVYLHVLWHEASAQ